MSEENPPLIESAQTSPGSDRAYVFTGVTLRDLFAGMAMQAELNAECIALAFDKIPSTQSQCEIAETAYTIADAMLAERAKGKS